LPIFVEYFLKESYWTNITYFQVTGTPLHPWYGSRLRNYVNLGFEQFVQWAFMQQRILYDHG